MATTLLTESFTSPHAHVDAAAGIIRKVKVLGFISQNGRRYPTETLDRAAPLYENARVNVDHADPRGGHDSRRLSDRFGILKHVRREEDGLYADLHYLRTHPLAELLAEAATRMPETLGLSHHAEGRVRQSGGETIVEEIVRVRGVDLVGEPATTRGLFESCDSPRSPVSPQGESMNERDVPLEANDEGVELLEEVRRLRAECESRDLLAEARLPAERPLVEALSLLADRSARKRLIETIERLSQRSLRDKPMSVPRHGEEAFSFANAEQFARSLRR